MQHIVEEHFAIVIYNNVPEVIVTFASDKFDSKGNLLDDNTKKFLTQLLQNLSNWTKRLRDKKTPSI